MEHVPARRLSLAARGGGGVVFFCFFCSSISAVFPIPIPARRDGTEGVGGPRIKVPKIPVEFFSEVEYNGKNQKEKEHLLWRNE